MNITTDDAERFWGKVSVGPQQDCWPWLAARIGHTQYGQFWCDGTNRVASRVLWQMITGDDPGVLFVCHTCDNPGCCNPLHFWLGTHDDNMADRDAKGRTLRGENHPRSPLTESDVHTIRRLHAAGTAQRMLARLYNIDRASIRNIINRKSWSHI